MTLCRTRQGTAPPHLVRTTGVHGVPVQVGARGRCGGRLGVLDECLPRARAVQQLHFGEGAVDREHLLHGVEAGSVLHIVDLDWGVVEK